MPAPRADLRISNNPSESGRDAFRAIFDALSTEDQLELFRSDADGVSRMTLRPDGTCFGVQIIRPILDGPVVYTNGTGPGSNEDLGA